MKQKSQVAWIKNVSVVFTMIALIAMPMNDVNAQSIDVDGSAAIIIDADTGQILYEENSDEQLAIASMTKMMTEYLVLEAIEEGQISWDDEVSVSEHLYPLSHQPELSNMPLRSDFTYTVEQLYDSMAIYSANASTIALAEHVAGSETAFVQQMNDKAEEMGLEKYDFVNSSGLNNSDLDGNHPEGTAADGETTLSARSVALLAYNLLQDYPEVLDTASIPDAEFEAGPDETLDMPNWNWMLPGKTHFYEGVDGLKTGYTSAAGNSFTATAVQDNVRLITVIMGADTRDDRFDETAKLLDHGFDNFNEEIVIEEGQEPENNIITVAGGKETEVPVVTSEDLAVMIGQYDDNEYTVEIDLAEEKTNEDGELLAPIEEGEPIGTLKVTFANPTDYIQGNQQSGVDLVAVSNVEEAGWFTMSMRGIGGFFSGVWTSITDTVSGWFS
ncbi:D-alanyl-D-alanine carboxypeptidase family protein [Bacillus sp. JCM 19041]|uniref:D-alanyl-D-alanine carboxypeptidase family protein n=1 Tax=Bacillus sp. JCM 19041 TaxID=1460637 RepID=UPI000AC7593D